MIIVPNGDGSRAGHAGSKRVRTGALSTLFGLTDLAASVPALGFATALRPRRPTTAFTGGAR